MIFLQLKRYVSLSPGLSVSEAPLGTEGILSFSLVAGTMISIDEARVASADRRSLLVPTRASR